MLIPMSHDIFNTEYEFTDRTFEELDFRNQSIENRVFDNCTFSRVNFNGSSFKRCRFLDCRFEQSDLSNLILTSSDLRDVTFKECKLVGVTWINASSLMHLSWDNCALNYGNFSGLDLRKSSMQNCVAREVDFAETNFSEANLRGTDFTAARFANTNLTKTDLRQAKNYSIRPDSNKIKKAKFSLPEAMLLLYGLDIELEE